MVRVLALVLVLVLVPVLVPVLVRWLAERSSAILAITCASQGGGGEDRTRAMLAQVSDFRICSLWRGHLETATTFRLLARVCLFAQVLAFSLSPTTGGDKL